jgi:thiamine-phosphate diphosphorylase
VTRLPPLLVLTDRVAAAARGRTLAETVAAAVGAGARAVVFREKDLSHPDRRSLGAAVAAVMPPDGCLIVASDARLVTELGAAGVHLAAGDPWPEPAPTTVGRSCHDRAELRTAAAEGVNYVTVSPVYPTPSKPGYGPALGKHMLSDLTAFTDAPPVYALGGVDAARAPECLAAGAAGVAVMGAVMAAEDPAAAVEALLAALDATSGVKGVRG